MQTDPTIIMLDQLVRVITMDLLQGFLFALGALPILALVLGARRLWR